MILNKETAERWIGLTEMTWVNLCSNLSTQTTWLMTPHLVSAISNPLLYFFLSLALWDKDPSPPPRLWGMFPDLPPPFLPPIPPPPLTDRPNLQPGGKSMWSWGERLHTNTELPQNNTHTQAAPNLYMESSLILLTHFWYHHDQTRSHLLILLTSHTGSDLITHSSRTVGNGHLCFGDFYHRGSALTWKCLFCFGLTVLPCLRQKGTSECFKQKSLEAIVCFFPERDI